MENYAHKIIALEDIADSHSYCLRYDPVDVPLRHSIESRGVLCPVVVTPGPERKLVAGHRRYHAAIAAGLKKIGVFEIQQIYSPRDLFLFSVISNWNQNWQDLDRAYLLRKARDLFQYREEEAVGELLPAVGLASEKHVLELYLKVARLDAALLDLISSHKLPFRGAHLLARFERGEQAQFAKLIGSKLALTTNELIRILDLLYDFLKVSGQDIQGLMEESRLDSILNHPEWNPQLKAEKIIKALRTLRNPRLAAYELKFKSALKDLSNTADKLKIEAPRDFEEEGFWLHAKIQNPKSLDELMGLLDHKRNMLNSLFDIML